MLYLISIQDNFNPAPVFFYERMTKTLSEFVRRNGGGDYMVMQCPGQRFIITCPAATEPDLEKYIHHMSRIIRLTCRKFVEKPLDKSEIV